MSGKRSKSGPEKLSAYVLDTADYAHFRYIRYYWKSGGPRVGIAAALLAKLTPAGHQAARHDLLLPDLAPGEYPQLGPARVRIADVGREKFEKAGALGGIGDDRQRGRQSDDPGHRGVFGR